VKNKIVFVVTLATAFVGGVMLYAQSPFVNIDHYRHGNLAAAQNYIGQAYNRISDAQRANHGRLGGHAAHAKQLLSQANDEIRLAADAAEDR